MLSRTITHSKWGVCTSVYRSFGRGQVRWDSRVGRKYVDIVKIYVSAGNGGNGAVSFYRDRRISRGPADGGNGGRGGSVWFKSMPSSSLSLDFGGRRHFKAGHGGKGHGKGSSGACADDLVIEVPKGTLIYVVEEEKPVVVADLGEADSYRACRGGNGGRGNKSFQHARQMIADHADEGEEGEKKELILELKSVADTGLVGFPNAGKSSLLRKMSSAKPRIASFPFTTLRPVIGVIVEGEGSDTNVTLTDEISEEQRFTMADIPGILEGAHEGRGLGLDFLRHIERTSVLVFVLDMSRPDPVTDLKALFQELDEYSKGIRKTRESVIVANKLDKAKDGRKALAKLVQWLHTSKMDIDIYPCSALLGYGIGELKSALFSLVRSSSQEKRGLLKMDSPVYRKRPSRSAVDDEPEAINTDPDPEMALDDANHRSDSQEASSPAI